MISQSCKSWNQRNPSSDEQPKGPAVITQDDCKVVELPTPPVHPELVEGPSVHGSTGSPRADLVFSGHFAFVLVIIKKPCVYVNQ